MPPKKSNTLPEAELRIMKHLWQRPEATVADLVACVSETFRLAYTSVLTTVRTPKRKGYVRHRQDQRAFVYAACVADGDASKTEIRNVLSRFFGNSRERLLLSLLGEEEHRQSYPDSVRALDHCCNLETRDPGLLFAEVARLS